MNLSWYRCQFIYRSVFIDQSVIKMLDIQTMIVIFHTILHHYLECVCFYVLYRSVCKNHSIYCGCTSWVWYSPGSRSSPLSEHCIPVEHVRVGCGFSRGSHRRLDWPCSSRQSTWRIWTPSPHDIEHWKGESGGRDNN